MRNSVRILSMPLTWAANMATEPKLQNIALIGFMGTGKSAVGRYVASHLGFEYLDVDTLIETRAGKKISEIFAEEGETGFRRLESQVLTELKDVRNKLIATGGGLAAQGDNLERLKEFALVVCLWASPESIWKRVRGQKHRPLLNGDDPQGTIRELLAKREPFYKQADILVNTERRSIRQVAHQIIHQYQLEVGQTSKPKSERSKNQRN